MYPTSLVSAKIWNIFAKANNMIARRKNYKQGKKLNGPKTINALTKLDNKLGGERVTMIELV